jgi:hypothetical protein
MPKSIGVPTMGGVKSSLIDYAYGAGGGLVYSLASSLLGSGFIGSLASAAIAGSVIKGIRGEMIATMLGFMGILSAMGGAQVASAGGSQGVM